MRFIILAFLVLFSVPATARATSFDIVDIPVRLEDQDAVKAKDKAIQIAQRRAFAKLVGRDEADLKHIDDIAIARLVNGFSLRNERRVGRSYGALFTIRFDPARTQHFITTKDLDIVEQAAGDTAPVARATPTAVTQNTVLIIPVLDIGSRRVLWDEPNPWRDMWQKRDYSMDGLTVQVPLGDIADMRDVPDARFLSGGEVDMPAMLGRYGATRAYVLQAKNQGAALDPSGGMAVSLYEHDGARLVFLRKIILHPRPGYAFADALDPALQLVVMAENRSETDDSEDNIAHAPQAETPEPERAAAPVAQPPAPKQAQTSGPVIVTIPYQSLAQWVNIQKRLRATPGIQTVLPVRVSPSSARVEIITGETPERLMANLNAAGFDLQALTGGELALIER